MTTLRAAGGPVAAPLFFIVNLAAGSGRAARVWRSMVEELRRRRIAYEYELTQGPLTATSFTRQALRAGAETVVAVGGDGTVNEVVNGFFLGEGPVGSGASMAVVPAGSSSDLARALRIPSGLAALNVLLDGRVIEIDVGRAVAEEGGRPTVRYFANNADVGIGARIAAGGRRFKWAGGGIAFFLSSLEALADPQPWEGTIDIDGSGPEPVRAVTVVVALGPYTGGGMRIAPTAKVDDGAFDVVTVGPMNTAELLLNFPRVYLGTHLSHPKVSHRRATHVSVRTDDVPRIELDGEPWGSGNAEMELLPRALRARVPRP